MQQKAHVMHFGLLMKFVFISHVMTLVQDVPNYHYYYFYFAYLVYVKFFFWVVI